MSTAIAHIENHNSAAIAPVVPQDKVQLLIDTVAPGLSKPQLALFVQVCNRVRLDPFAKQIYAIVRNEWDAETRTKRPKMVIQTGIDGYRTIAERTGELDGGTLHEWCGHEKGPDGKPVWVDVWLEDEPPAAARATVYRKGRRPQSMTARWGAYVQTKQDGSATKMWTQRGPEQLAKCAEALALRLQFPDTMEGVYTNEEMAQADNDREREPVKALAKPAEGPRVPSNYPDTEIAGRLLSTLNGPELITYMEQLDIVLQDASKKRFHDKTQAMKDAAEQAYDAVVVAQAEQDPIAQGLQKHIDERDAKRSGIDDSDTNSDWGLSSPGDQA